MGVLHFMYDFEKCVFHDSLAGQLAKLVDGSFGGDDSVVDDRYAVAKAFDLAHDVGGEYNGQIIDPALLDEGHDRLGSHDV
jgi:hypothetical protein